MAVEGFDNDNDLWGGIPTGGTPAEDFWSGAESSTDYSEEQETTVDDYWEQTSNESQGYMSNTDIPQQSSEEFWQNQAEPNNFGQKKDNLSTPILIVAFVIVCGIILAFVYFLLNIEVKKKPVQQNPAPAISQQVQQPTKQAQTTPAVTNGSVSLMPLDDSVHIDYSGVIYESTGLVTGKLKYLQNNQVVYCIEVSIQAGATTQKIAYYCSYSTWSAVRDGDIVSVKYQQVSNNCFSVNEILK